MGAILPASPAGPPLPRQRRGLEVDGITCRSGHLNPPAGRWCIQCGGSMVGRQSFTGRGPRPAVGAIVDDTGEVTAVDADIDLGRRAGGSRSRLAMADPDGAAKVIVSGWEVQLRASTGSGVEVDGQPLVEGCSVGLGPRAVIRIGRRVAVFESFVADPGRTA